ncbi:EpsG family protein [Apibacter muscae]|uniref:EpsG family protein n=1 Tax=Apibacter muscae TaxID=2509004 RepID=UPI0011AE0D35|nr:EpsG family protein [Apibacter muscae]TWP22555.1 EpsG family protein [Apibacter muscae]
MLHPIYYLILIILTLLSFKEINKTKLSKSIFIFFCVIFILLAGLRVAQGADYWPYFHLYMASNSLIPWNEVFSRALGIEPSYVIISKFIGIFLLPFNVFLLVYAGISIYLKGFSIYNFSPLPFFSLLYFFMPGFFVSDMGHMRQALAGSLCMYSFQYINSRKLLPYLICMLVAYNTHKTSIAFIPAYWIANLNISTYKAIFIVILGLILWPLKPYILIGEWANSISSDSLAAESFNSYANFGEDTGFTLTEVVKIILFIIIIANDKNILKNDLDGSYMKVRNLIIAFFFIYYSFHGNPIFSIRLAAIYQTYECIFVGMLVFYSRRSKLIYTYFIIYVYLISIRYWNNAQAVGFDKFNTVFNAKEFNLKYFTPQPYSTNNRTKN